MPLSDIIKGQIVSCSPDDSIKTVADIMKSKDVGAILVTDQGQKPVGIITDRDIVLRCISERNSLGCKVGEVMTRSVDCVKLGDGIQDVIKHMRSKAIRRIPVVDDSGKAVGLVSFGDIVGLLAKELSELSAATPLHVAA